MKTQLTHYIRAGYAGLYITSHEETRVEAVLKQLADETAFNLFAWSITTGIVDTKTGQAKAAEDPMDMLIAFADLPPKSILLARDFHLHLSATDNNPVLLRKLKDVLVQGKNSNRVFIILGCQFRLPPELEKEFTVIDFNLPDREQLRAVLANLADSAQIKLNGNTEAVLDAASGLTTIEAENAFALSLIQSKDFLPANIAREKAATIKKNGILEIIDTPANLTDIGGLDALKTWVGKRRLAFSKEARNYGLPTPKGFLMIGIPGCGKSLTAKATANILGVPLLKLDAGKIFASHVGESERNLRTAIQTAEAVAPCVLWCDELEKGFSGSKSSGSTDGGTAARVFASFLQWLQEKTAPVFIVATANDISQLPPELLRKGRFDEIWFIDLPNPAERRDIWRIQITRLGRDPERFDLDALAQLSEGWTGSEIEALFTEALFAAFDSAVPAEPSLRDSATPREFPEPTTALLTQLAKDLVPLSKTMSDQVEALRHWSKGRARRATPQTTTTTPTRKLANN